jgi:GT2 family glycosyltransferase
MLTRNALELTKQAVESVLAQDVPVHPMVVDNGSTDGTVEWLQSQGIHHYAVGHQLGVSRGWNYGLRYFFETGAEHVWVVNNDAVYRPDTLRELIDDGGPFVTGVGCQHLEDIHCQFKKNVWPHPSFSCFLIRREVWEKVGPFDESMVMYASDGDYHIRMSQAGFTAYTIGMPFYHVLSGTIKYATGGEQESIRLQADKDRQRFKDKWGCEIGTPEYYALFSNENWNAEHKP